MCIKIDFQNGWIKWIQTTKKECWRKWEKKINFFLFTLIVGHLSSTYLMVSGFQANFIYMTTDAKMTKPIQIFQCGIILNATWIQFNDIIRPLNGLSIIEKWAEINAFISSYHPDQCQSYRILCKFNRFIKYHKCLLEFWLERNKTFFKYLLYFCFTIFFSLFFHLWYLSVFVLATHHKQPEWVILLWRSAHFSFASRYFFFFSFLYSILFACLAF